MYQLYGGKGCGSAAIEAALVLLALPFENIPAEPWQGGPAVDSLRRHNPLAQIPTLILPDGTVLSESVAILIWLAEQHPAASLLPGDPSRRATVLRWLVYLGANNYAAIGVGDFPERWTTGEAEQSTLKAFARARLEEYWRILESQLSADDHLFSPTLTVLDLLAATMSHWRPGQAWFRQHCPQLCNKLDRTLQDPRLQAVWSRNFA